MNKRFLALIGCVLFLAVIGYPIRVTAESSLPTDYSNQVTNYIPDAYGTCRTSFVTSLQDVGYQTGIYDNGILYVNNYDSNYQLIWSKQVELELPLWGGLYLGENYNYVVCGQNYNTSLTDGGEVYRVIQYDKEFNRINSISFTGAETYTGVPFDSGNVSMDEEGERLTVYTGRYRLDGHQSNIALHINTNDMTNADSSGMWGFPKMHVSHSFRQIIKYDNESPVYVDLSDSYPARSVYLQNDKYGKKVLNISGQDGNNVTNAEVTGLEISDTHYLVTGTYIYQGNSNVYLSGMDKDSGEVSVQWLTDSSMFQPKYVANSRICQISEKRYIVMWGVVKLGEQVVNYVIVDDTGTIVSEVKEKTGVSITDCEPIFDNGKLIWLSGKNGELSFCEIIDFEEGGSFELKNTIIEAVNPWDGTADKSWYSDNAEIFQITTPQQLAGLAELVNAGNAFENKSVYLGNDIFLNDESYTYEWIPIDGWEGTFCGNDFHIYNMYTSESAYGGLFGTIGENGIVKAVNISQGFLYSGGCIANLNKGTIAHCSNYSHVGAYYNDVGGICNENHNLVYGCKNYGEVWGSGPGGIVGKNRQTLSVVSQCSNWGFVEGTDESAGVVGDNYGWIYNCYNRGIVSNGYLGNINYGRSLSGIVENNISCEVENCYSVGYYAYNDDLWMGVYAINRGGEDIVNCYSSPVDGNIGMASVVSVEDMQTREFLEKLDCQTNTVLSAWMEDNECINDGLPITVADYSYAKGIYKIQPELWISSYNKDIVIDIEDGEYSVSASCYYNEELPVVTIENEQIAEVSYENGYIRIKPLNGGSTHINIHFNETENNVSGDYQLNLTVTAPVVDKIDSFVTRMYQQCLSRDPDEAGLEGWAGQLKGGYMNGAQIAEQFVFSNEMLSKNLSNKEFVNVLYRSMMGREADEAGRSGWVNQLDNGYMTRSEVTKNFVESVEFTAICSDYDIIRGDYDASIAPIERFVTRFYTLCLERTPDQAGLYGWVGNLKNKYMNGAQIANAFIFSDEFVKRNVTDEKYIELLYNTLMGRPSDEGGKAGWLRQLANGWMTRKDMMKAFIESKEFGDICETYDITRGTVE